MSLGSGSRARVHGPQDLKAWFRRAAALEGLGRCEEAGSALDAVERLAVGRVDRPRVAREVLQRRQRLGAWEARQAAMERRAAQRALRRGVFAREERELEELEEELRQLEAEAAEAEAVECDVAFAVGDRGLAVAEWLDGGPRCGHEELLGGSPRGPWRPGGGGGQRRRCQGWVVSREFYLAILDLNVAYVDSYLAVTIIGGWYSVRYIIKCTYSIFCL